MSYTSNLKNGVDIPVWEYLKGKRLSSTSEHGGSTISQNIDGRYIYLNSSLGVSSVYDSYNDGWEWVLSASNTTTIANKGGAYSKNLGVRGYVISSPAANQIQTGLPLFNTNSLIGATIRIVAGKGKGQTRTITNISTPTVALADKVSGYVTGLVSSTAPLVENAYVGYALMLNAAAAGSLATNSGLIVIKNTSTGLYVYDNYALYSQGVLAAQQPQMGLTANMSYQLQSNIITVDSAWTVQPDNTSIYVIETGSVWWGTTAASLMYQIQTYTPAYGSTTNAIFGGRAISESISSGSTLDMVSMGTYLTPYVIGTATSGAAGPPGTLTDSTKTLTANYWRYFYIRITGGTGMGQTRQIVSHTSDTFTVNIPWATVPDATSTYEIISQQDMIWIRAGGCSGVARFNQNSYTWNCSPLLYGEGIISQMAAIKCDATGTHLNEEVWPLLSVVGNAGTAVATMNTSMLHSLKVGDYVLIYGCTSGDFSTGVKQITAVAANLTSFSFATATNVTATYNSVGLTTIVDPTKNWAVNEHANRICRIQTGTNQVGASPTGLASLIVSNTATTLTLATSLGTDPASYLGYSTYVIEEPTCIGASSLPNAVLTSTGGSTTTITSTGAGWGTNQWAGRRVKILAGSSNGAMSSGVGWESTIASNTADTLNFSTITGLTPGTTTRFAILEDSVPASTYLSFFTWLYGSTGPRSGDGRHMFWYSSGAGATSKLGYVYDISSNSTNFVTYPVSPANALFSYGGCTYDGADTIYFHIYESSYNWGSRFHDIYSYKFDTATWGSLPPAPGTAGTGYLPYGNKLTVKRTPDGVKYLYFLNNGYTALAANLYHQEMYRILLP